MVILITFYPFEMEFEKDLKGFGAKGPSLGHGKSALLDLHQENTAESCRCGRSIDAGLRLNDDTNK